MRFNFVGINSISHPKPAVWPSLSQGECLKDNALPVSQLNLFIFTGSGKNPVQLGEFALADHLHSQVDPEDGVPGCRSFWWFISGEELVGYQHLCLPGVVDITLTRAMMVHC